ncbi:MAG: hypothetical protein LBQ82_03920 [Treponema sp.]|jgi:hypothetical protein|nr:hypothetical protein [Treponema sp.]
MKKIIYVLLAVLIILGACSTGDAAAATTAATGAVFGESSEALVFLNCKAVSEDEIEFEFSQSVTVMSVNFEPDLSVASVENGSVVKVKLDEIPEPGVQFTADLLAEDAGKNTINVIVPFRSRNNRMPKLVINELFTEYSTPKAEFIELKMKSDGNLGAMRVVILGNSTASKHTVYEFMPCEVKNGDYVVIHLRTLEESCINEYNGNIEESGSTNSSPTAWDFYALGNTKLIQKTATAVYVLDQDDNVLDAVMISETPDSWWKKDYLTEAAEFLFEKSAWKSLEGEICSPANAVDTSGIKTAKTKSISRDENAEDTNTAADWHVTASSGATPGKPNK